MLKVKGGKVYSRMELGWEEMGRTRGLRKASFRNNEKEKRRSTYVGDTLHRFVTSARRISQDENDCEWSHKASKTLGKLSFAGSSLTDE